MRNICRTRRYIALAVAALPHAGPVLAEGTETRTVPPHVVIASDSGYRTPLISLPAHVRILAPEPVTATAVGTFDVAALRQSIPRQLPASDYPNIDVETLRTSHYGSAADSRSRTLSVEELRLSTRRPE